MNAFKITSIFILVLAIFACKNQRTNQSGNESKSVNETISLDTFYIDESEVNSNKWKEYTDDTLEVNTPIIDSPQHTQNPNFEKIIQEIDFKTLPFIDSTNFDNFKERRFYNKNEVTALQLEVVYPEYYKEGYNYKAIDSYQVKYSEKFHSLVITFFKGVNEMESRLINYDLKGEYLDSKVISYDEIAEGWFRVESKLENHQITVTNINWVEEKQEEVEVFEVGGEGQIIPVATTVSSN